MQTIVSLASAGMGVALAPRTQCNLRRTGVVYRLLAEMHADRRDGARVAPARRPPGARPTWPFDSD
jgi:DNA-binding transcriptional LysR family regulator